VYYNCLADLVTSLQEVQAAGWLALFRMERSGFGAALDSPRTVSARLHAGGASEHSVIPMHARRAVLLVILSSTITLTLQGWVGTATIYSPQNAARRLAAHEILLHNRLPEGRTWTSIGSNSANVRIATVYLAEGVHRVTGLPLAHVYWGIDSLALFASLLLLFGLLRGSGSTEYALIGLLYVAAVLPLTYFLHVFHPEDRASLLCWVLLLRLLRDRKMVLFSIVLALSIPVKFDTVLIPALYLLCYVSRSNWRTVAVRTAALFAISFGTYVTLRVLIPGGFEPRSIVGQLRTNLYDLRSMHVWYPPFLSLALPGLLALAGLRATDRFGRACAAFAVLMSMPLLIATNFAEFRAEMPVLVLLLPAALAGLERVVSRQEGPGEQLGLSAT
jgi:hypothetical protein